MSCIGNGQQLHTNTVSSGQHCGALHPEAGGEEGPGPAVQQSGRCAFLGEKETEATNRHQGEGGWDQVLQRNVESADKDQRQGKTETQVKSTDLTWSLTFTVLALPGKLFVQAYKCTVHIFCHFISKCAPPPFVLTWSTLRSLDEKGMINQIICDFHMLRLFSLPTETHSTLISFQHWTDWETVQDWLHEELFWEFYFFDGSSGKGRGEIAGVLHHKGERLKNTNERLDKVRSHTNTLKLHRVLFIRLHRRRRNSGRRETVWMAESARWSWKIGRWKTISCCSATVTPLFVNPSTKPKSPVRLTEWSRAPWWNPRLIHHLCLF